MKKLVTKKQLRESLEQATAQFLHDGGEVTNVPRGISGRDSNDHRSLHSRSLFVEPKSSRTPVPEVLAAIESRKSMARKNKARKPQRKPSQPRRKMLYDDFGEPLRQVWVDD